MRGKTLSIVLFFVFLFLVSAHYGEAKECDGTIKSENLELTECSFDLSKKVITGKIKNNSKYTFDQIRIRFATYNKAGETTGTKVEFTNYLGPNETWNFEITGLDTSTVRVKPVDLTEWRSGELKKEEFFIESAN